MKNLLQWISQGLRSTSKTEEERYLSQATSLEDLERRQRLIKFGKAPYQCDYKYYNDIGRNGRAY